MDANTCPWFTLLVCFQAITFWRFLAKQDEMQSCEFSFKKVEKNLCYFLIFWTHSTAVLTILLCWYLKYSDLTIVIPTFDCSPSTEFQSLPVRVLVQNCSTSKQKNKRNQSSFGSVADVYLLFEQPCSRHRKFSTLSKVLCGPSCVEETVHCCLPHSPKISTTAVKYA